MLELKKPQRSAPMNGISQGITAAINGLQDPADYQVISSALDNR
jgi:hypothetical protein